MCLHLSFFVVFFVWIVKFKGCLIVWFGPTFDTCSSFLKNKVNFLIEVSKLTELSKRETKVFNSRGILEMSTDYTMYSYNKEIKTKISKHF